MLSLIYTAVLIFAQLSSQQPTNASITVQAPAGPIVGHPLNGINEFLGIPFAQPPIGPLRFSAPQRHPRWTTPFEAKKFGPPCWQAPVELGPLSPAINFTRPPGENEDCLHANVWAKPGLKNAAVMLWVYGGAFHLGSSDTFLFNGNVLARDHDVIVVNFNRLNVFGFPNSPDLPARQKNPGLLDVRLATEWVRDNIRSFGGDPRRITMFGVSAGAAATDLYLYTNVINPIISGAILQSGTSYLPTANPLNDPPGPQWSQLSEKLACSTIECMRSVSAKKLAVTLAEMQLTFTPAIDGGTIYADTPQRLESGFFAHVPILVGSNDQEIPGTTDSAVATTKKVFGCPAARSAAAPARKGRSWQYRYFGKYGLVPWGTPGPFHGSDMEMVFGTYEYHLGVTQEQRVVSSYMQKAWTAFAKDPRNGLKSLGWPTFDKNSKTLIRLGLDGAAVADYADPELYQAGCLGSEN